jgi:hypothetical protein
MALGGAMALMDQGMAGAADDFLKENRRTDIGSPTAHHCPLTVKRTMLLPPFFKG